MMAFAWRAARDKLMTPKLCVVLAFITTTEQFRDGWDAQNIDRAARELGFSRIFISRAIPRLIELGYLRPMTEADAHAPSYCSIIDAELPADRLRGDAQ